MLEEKSVSQKGNKKIIIAALVLLLVLGGIGAGVYAYRKEMDYQNLKKEQNDSKSQEEVQEKQAQEVVDQLSAVLFIEEDSAKPAVATVTDANKLRETQPEFYKHAKEGDHLVVYPNRAIIFRKDEKKIINVAPIIQPPQTEANNNNTPATNNTTTNNNNNAKK